MFRRIFRIYKFTRTLICFQGGDPSHWHFLVWSRCLTSDLSDQSGVCWYGWLVGCMFVATPPPPENEITPDLDWNIFKPKFLSSLHLTLYFFISLCILKLVPGTNKLKCGTTQYSSAFLFVFSSDYTLEGWIVTLGIQCDPFPEASIKGNVPQPLTVPSLFEAESNILKVY